MDLVPSLCTHGDDYVIHDSCSNYRRVLSYKCMLHRTCLSCFIKLVHRTRKATVVTFSNTRLHAGAQIEE